MSAILKVLCVALLVAQVVHADGKQTKGNGVLETEAKPGTGTSVVVEQPGVTADLNLKMVPSEAPGDSQRWWPRRQDGWDRFGEVRAMFPRSPSIALDSYLTALAEGFNRAIPLLPHIRFHFYIADTLNPSIWPLGGGFFVFHAGVPRAVRDERQFAFIVALELAHETLGHNDRPVRYGDFAIWPIEQWGMLVGSDPLERSHFSYSLQQESDALELVYWFFEGNYWAYDSIGRLATDLIPTLNAISGASSLASLHPNLGLAIQLPHARPQVTGVFPVDSMVSRSTYEVVRRETGTGDHQKYPWLLELIPYRSVVLNPKADQADIDAINEEMSSRDRLVSAKLARLYLRGTVLLRHRRWKEVLTNAAEGLKLEAGAEPFLWQRTLARQEMGKFNTCAAELIGEHWRTFDHFRELLYLECTFLAGRYTDAGAAARQYRINYPYDIMGAFWYTLTQIRLKRESQLAQSIAEIEAFWGDRPIVRALKIFYYAELGRTTLVHEMIDLQSTLPYSDQEWGILEFAKGWYFDTEATFRDDDHVAELNHDSDAHWPLAHLVRLNMPRDFR